MKKIFTMLLACACTIGMMNAQWTEDFEGGIPMGWEATGNWNIGTSTDASSQYFAPADHTTYMWLNDDALGNGVEANGFVYTGDIDLTSMDSPLLKFQAFFVNGDYQGADEYARVHVSTDAGATWTQVANLDGAGAAWYDANINLADYGGMTIRLAFEYDDGDGWNYGFCFDDIEISNFSTQHDVTVIGRGSSCTGGADGALTTISGTFTNNGIATITSLDISYTDGTTTVDETLTGLDVASFATAGFEFATPYALGTSAVNITVSASNPNGEMDENMDDNMSDAVGIAAAITPLEMKAVVAEEATGTWCPWCPRGAVFLDRMADCYGKNFVGIAVHNSDPMVVAEHDSWVGSFPGFSGYPSVIFNRSSVIDPSELESPTVLLAKIFLVTTVS